MTVELPELPDLPDSCWPVDTSCCEDWDDWLEEPVEADPEADPPVEATEGVPLYSETAKARAIALAGQTMRLLTGYRVGGCPIVVRPCRRSCSESGWRTFPQGMSGLSAAPWTPIYAGGSWLNIGCGCSSSCSCSTVHEIALGQPASAVTQVKVDGATLSTGAYRLDPGGLLVRTDGDAWPLCQDLNSPDTEPGTWSVTYTPGLAVDGLGAWAAGILACEYVKACTGGECRLSTRVTQVVRQGVTLTLSAGLFPDNKTGIAEVDSIIERWNPYGLKAPSTIWSPDVKRPRVT